MTIAYIDRTEPVLRLKLRPTETAAGEAEWTELLIALPVVPNAASHPPPTEEDEPTWEDAEWQ